MACRRQNEQRKANEHAPAVKTGACPAWCVSYKLYILERFDLGPQLVDRPPVGVDRLLLLLYRLDEDRYQLDVVDPLVSERFVRRLAAFRIGYGGMQQVADQPGENLLDLLRNEVVMLAGWEGDSCADVFRRIAKSPRLEREDFSPDRPR
jgi:hypothetical protein